MSELTHFNETGEAQMVDVSAKDATHRVAVAEGTIRMQDRTLALIMEGGHKKGDVLGIARVAGIMAAKKTAETHPTLPSPGRSATSILRWNPDLTISPFIARLRSRPSARPALKWRH